MTEAVPVEAVRAVGGAQAGFPADGALGAGAVANPSSVAKFQSAMAADGVPFASEVAATWRSALENNQGIIHRIRALSELKDMHSPAALNLVELQYEVMNLSFQQEVVTKVADKSSNAIQTLVKNQ